MGGERGALILAKRRRRWAKRSKRTGFRNVLVHGYLGLDVEIVWHVVEGDLPALRDALLRLRRSLGAAADKDG